MIALSRPSPEAVARFLERQQDQPFSYPSPGATRVSAPPPGFVVDRRRREIGRGQAAFEAACAGLRRWEMFHLGWIEICRPWPPIETDANVAVLVRYAGLWWLNATRIVYVLDEPRRFGFAYGTLPEHAEQGEERFSVEWRDDDSVWYDLYAFSRPGTWLVRLGYPLTRRLQKRFGAGSVAAMERWVQTPTPPDRTSSGR